jgi:hypothetical protein
MSLEQALTEAEAERRKTRQSKPSHEQTASGPYAQDVRQFLSSLKQTIAHE